MVLLAKVLMNDEGDEASTPSRHSCSCFIVLWPSKKAHIRYYSIILSYCIMCMNESIYTASLLVQRWKRAKGIKELAIEKLSLLSTNTPGLLL